MDETVKLKLLAKHPYNIFKIKDICSIKPLTLGEIVEIGWEKYNTYLYRLTADIDDYKIPGIDLSEYSYWDLLMSNMYYDQEGDFVNTILTALKIFLKKKEIIYIKEAHLFVVNKKIIDKEIFEEIVKILKWQNCIESNENKPKMANSRAEEIRKKILKGRADLNKRKNNIVEFSDLVSVLAANGNNLNITNIWDLTLYQFNNQFNRMKMIEDYDIGIRQLLSGAKGSDIDLKHYIRPIESNKDL